MSLVIPLHNEEEVLPHLKNKILELGSRFPERLEIILVDDGSSDNTVNLIESWVNHDRNVKAIIFSRNFGQQNAISAGLNITAGEAVVIMDADLQDPPELILELIKKYNEGFDIVYAKRSSREQDGLIKKLTAFLFYRIFSSLISSPASIFVPHDVGEFKLMSKDVVSAFRLFKEKHRFTRGLVGWLGFSHTIIDFTRPARKDGKSSYSFAKTLSLACDAIFSFSLKPLRMITIVGLLITAFGLTHLLCSSVQYLMYEISPSDKASLLIPMLILNGVTLICVGVVGEYIGRIYEEIKGRPLYVIKNSLNVANNPEDIF